jgi:menaquinone-specific isochorismate synthase
MDSTRSEGQPAATATQRVVVRGCRVETAPVRAVLTALDRPRLGWADATETLAAGGTTAVVTASGPERFDTVSRQAGTVFEELETVDPLPAGARPRFYGGFAFTDGHGGDPGEAGPPTDHTWRGFPAAKFALPAVQFSLTADGAWLTAAGTGPNAESTATARLERWRNRLEALPEFDVSSPPGVRGRAYEPSRAAWHRQVEAAVSRIRDGQLRKVVLAQSLSVDLEEPVTVADLLARLGDSYPGCYRFLFEGSAGGSFFGATPERLVTVGGNSVETEALAGSIGRGETKAEDEWLANQLRESEKNNHEHDLVVEAVRDQLAGLTDGIETGERSIRQLANVQHLRTPLRASLSRQKHVLTLVEALHPTPAVGGLPPGRALETIRETEAFDRGWYAAPVGWFDADGNGTFAVAIRSAVARGTGARLFAGAGIVRDSDPDAEWDELQLKYRPVLDELV